MLMEYIWNNNIITQVDWEKQHEFPQARDVLINFNKTLYPEIEQKYHPEKWKVSDFTKKAISKIFGWTFIPTERSYEELGIQTSQWITNFILWEYPTDPSRIQLLLQAMWLDMMSIAYGNVYLDYSNASNRYGEQGDEVKQNIIKECLKICDEKFWWKVVTLSITDNHVIFEYVRSWEKIVQDKKDFLKNHA